LQIERSLNSYQGPKPHHIHQRYCEINELYDFLANFNLITNRCLSDQLCRLNFGFSEFPAFNFEGLKGVAIVNIISAHINTSSEYVAAMDQGHFL
jgi:hypothetical protein